MLWLEFEAGQRGLFSLAVRRTALLGKGVGATFSSIVSSRQVRLGAAHFAFSIRQSCLFAYGRLAPFTFVLLTDAGLSLLAQSLHSKAYFYRFGCTAFRTSIFPRGWVLFFGAFRVALPCLILVLRAVPCFSLVSGVLFVFHCRRCCPHRVF